MKKIIYSKWVMCLLVFMFVLNQHIAQVCYIGIAKDSIQLGSRSVVLGTDGQLVIVDERGAEITVSPWFGADVYGDIRTSIVVSPTKGYHDFYPGPLDFWTFENNEIHCKQWDKVFKVTKKEIERFELLLRFNNLEVEDIPESILYWPGKNNPHLEGLNIKRIGAPFYDENSDGVYDPMEGDSPFLFNKEEMLFSIVNDDGLHSEGHGSPLKKAISTKVFVFNSSKNELVRNTVFVRLELFNNSYEDLPVEISNLLIERMTKQKEFIRFGSLPEKDAIYFFNNANEIGVEGDSSIILVNILRKPIDKDAFLQEIEMSGVMSYDEERFSLIPDEDLPKSCFNLMRQRFADGVPLTYGGDGYDESNTDTVHYINNDLVSESSEWNTCFEKQEVKKKTALMSLESRVLKPGDRDNLFFAISYIDKIPYSPCENIDSINNALDEIKTFFERIYSYDFTDDKIKKKVDLVFYPNPTKGIVTMTKNRDLRVKKVLVYDLLGRSLGIIYHSSFNYSVFDFSEFANGHYYMKLIFNDGSQKVQKIIVSK